MAGEMRYQPAITSVPQVPSEASCSLVVLLRREISTLTQVVGVVGGAAEGEAAAGGHRVDGGRGGGVIGAGELIAVLPMVFCSERRCRR